MPLENCQFFSRVILSGGSNSSGISSGHRCGVWMHAVVDRGIAVNGRTEVSLRSDGCAAGGHGSDVRRVEHVQAVVSLTSSRRGHVELYLTSPGGTRSTLLSGRRGSHNNSSDNNNIIDHPRSDTVYYFGPVCLSVCQMITFQRLDIGSSCSHIRYISTEYGSSSYMKVIGSRSPEQKG